MADHLIIAPVVLPLVAGAVMLLLGERRRDLKAAISVASTFALVGIAVALLEWPMPRPGAASPRRRLPARRLAGAVRDRARRSIGCRRSCCF